MAILLVDLFKLQQKHTSVYEIIPINNAFQHSLHIHLSNCFHITIKLYIFSYIFVRLLITSYLNYSTNQLPFLNKKRARR
jgi:hypothetical protein